MSRELEFVPINRVAAKVIGKGISWDPTVCQGEPVFDVQPLTRPPTHAERGAQGFVDLTGARSGDLVAIGISRGKEKRWVCRCDCALYVFRTSKSIKANKTGKDSCPRCAAKRMLYGR
jgi:hypothetical protein